MEQTSFLKAGARKELGQELGAWETKVPHL